MPVSLIISDVDGCISPEESVAWDLGRFTELCRLSREASAGRIPLAPMTLCTGRPQPYVEALMKIMDIRFPAICENGAVIYELSSNHAQYAPGVTAEKVTGLRAVRCFIEDEILPGCPQAVIQFGKEAQLSVFSKEPAIFDRMRAQILDFVAQRGGPDLVINASHFYLNISLAKLDKGSAIRHILELANLNKSQVAGIGDTVGDLPLRDEVAFFACPANATPDIKAVADYVSPHANLPGVLDILTQAPLRRA